MVPLAMTIRFLFCHLHSKYFRENGTTRNNYLFFFVIREPSGMALAMCEAIPLVKRKMACAQNTTGGGQLRNPHTGHASLAGTTACP